MRKSTVLVVDDEPHILVIVKTMLETAGLDIITTDDPHRALAIVEEQKNQIAFVLSDVRMPGMDGPQLLRRIVEVSPGTGVALMSGYAGQDSAEKSNIPIITKPFRSSTLISAIQELLARHTRLAADMRAHVEKTMQLTEEIGAIAVRKFRRGTLHDESGQSH